MNKEILEKVISETNALIAAGSVCKEAKEAAESFLKSVGTSAEKEETAKYIKELEEDIEPIDDLVAFANSPLCEQLFGKDRAEGFRAHARELKESGAKHCDCPACAACADILALKSEILK